MSVTQGEKSGEPTDLCINGVNAKETLRENSSLLSALRHKCHEKEENLD